MSMTATSSRDRLSVPALPQPIRVCHVSLTLKTGGLERLLGDFARHNDFQKSVVHFLAIRETGRFAEEIKAGGHPVHLLKQTGRLGLVRQMAAYFKAHCIDVVHTHNTYPHLYATLAARWAGVPVVVQTRHGQRVGHGWKSRVSYRWAAKWVDRVVTVSDDAASLCIKSDGLPAEKVQRIWNGIDVSQFAYRTSQQRPVAISVARLSAEKDFPTLLKAVALVIKKVPEFSLRLVGDGAERPQLEQLVRDLHLEPHVEFLGERSDVPSLLAEAGFFVTSSLTEGISLTLLEAMAVGLPVVATAVGGNPEIVDEPRTGLLVAHANPEELAEAMVAMCQRQQDWQQIGLEARRRVEKYFEVGRMVQDYQQLYRQLLESKQRTH